MGVDLRRRNGGGCGWSRPFVVIAIPAAFVLAKYRGRTVTSAQASSVIGIMHLWWEFFYWLRMMNGTPSFSSRKAFSSPRKCGGNRSKAPHGTV